MKNKIGTIFIISIFALAGLSITYAGWTDTININGTVTTGTVDLEITDYSGTWAWKVYAEENEIIVTDDPDYSVPPEQGFLVAYGKGRPIEEGDPEGYDAIIEFEDIFPCIDFEADIVFQYTGTIPCIVSEIEYDWTGELIDLNDDEVPETDFIDYLQQLYIDTNGQYGLTGGFYRCNQNGELNQPLEEVTEETQIHPDEYFKLIVTIHLPQDNRLQNLTATGFVNIEVIQWNDPCDDQQTGDFASISDFVWYDTNHNGIQDPGEPGVEGVTVDLYQADDTYVSTDITDSDGLYMFEALTPGDYYLVFTLPTGYGFTNPDQGTDDETDSDVDPNTGYTIPTTLDEGENDPSWDAGVVEECIGSIGDYVWHDLNANGIQDDGEPGIQGVTVKLLYPNDMSTLDTTTTDANGYYLFNGMGAGNYIIEFVLPTDYEFTDKDIGDDDSLDSDVYASGYTDEITLDCSEEDLTIDAGLFETVECTEETAWGGDSEGEGNAWWYYFDTNGDSTQDITAGQHHTAGQVTVSDCADDEVTITITLTDGWQLQDVEESVKIEGYDSIPTSRPSAGSFTYKGEELVVNFDCYEFYAIHLDVQLCE